MTVSREISLGQKVITTAQHPAIRAAEWRWADAADSEAEDFDDVSSPEVCQEAQKEEEELCRARLTETSTLNASAPEFIPTMSMVCPLVGVCLFQAAAAAPEHLHLDQGVSPKPAESANADDVQQRRRRRKKAQHQPQQWGIMPEVSEDVWEERIAYRYKVLATLEARLLRLSRGIVLTEKNAESIIASSQEMSRTNRPDPEDRTVSRRQWRKAVDDWFKASLLQLEVPSSVASTEECVSTNCDGDSDGTNDS